MIRTIFKLKNNRSHEIIELELEEIPQNCTQEDERSENRKINSHLSPVTSNKLLNNIPTRV